MQAGQRCDVVPHLPSGLQMRRQQQHQPVTAAPDAAACDAPFQCLSPLPLEIQLHWPFMLRSLVHPELQLQVGVLLKRPSEQPFVRSWCTSLHLSVLSDVCMASLCESNACDQ